MAAVVGHFNFWNITSEKVLQEAWLNLENVKPLSITSSILSIGMSPIIVFANILVLLALWKDPLKKLRSSPSSFLLVSMALADLLVAVVICPFSAYWGWEMFAKGESPLDLSVIFAVNVILVNVSFGHMFLLTVHRILSVTRPFQYLWKVTNKRVVVASCLCWVYFLAFGCSFLVLRDYFAIMGVVYNVQLLFILFSMFIMNVVILVRFRRCSKESRVKRNQENSYFIILQREKELLKGIIIIVSAFLLCYMPWFIVQILIYLCKPCHPNLSWLVISFGFSGSLTYANSALNPILCAWRFPNYKKTIRHLWKNRGTRLNGQVKVQVGKL